MAARLRGNRRDFSPVPVQGLKLTSPMCSPGTAIHPLAGNRPRAVGAGMAHRGRLPPTGQVGRCERSPAFQALEPDFRISGSKGVTAGQRRATRRTPKWPRTQKLASQFTGASPGGSLSAPASLITPGTPLGLASASGFQVETAIPVVRGADAAPPRRMSLRGNCGTALLRSLLRQRGERLRKLSV
jgi:hypothetical protein